MNPFDVVSDINFQKKGIINEHNEKDYKPFIVNRSLSYFRETILYAQEMNTKSHLDNKLQYDYLMNTIRVGKRFSKWAKPIKDEDLKAVQDYFNYNQEKAQTALSILSEDQLKHIKRQMKIAKEF